MQPGRGAGISVSKHGANRPDLRRDVTLLAMRNPRFAVLVHVYYPELWGEIAARVRGLLDFDPDLYVNAVDGGTDARWASSLSDQFPNARIYRSPNLGQDVGGTISLLQHVDLSAYDLVCKLHTKRSQWADEMWGAGTGNRWRHELLSACLDNPAEVFKVFAEDERTTMLGSAKWVGTGLGRSVRDCYRLCDRLKLDPKYLASPWGAGSMFWCRPYVMQALKDANLSKFKFTTGYGRDGTLAHAVERIFGALAASRGE